MGAAGGGAWGFVRIVIQPIFDPPTPTGQAVEFIDHLLGSSTVRVLGPGSRHWELLRTILDEGQVRGELVTDAVIVALCREHGVGTVLSHDRDFDRFPGVKVKVAIPARTGALPRPGGIPVGRSPSTPAAAPRHG